MSPICIIAGAITGPPADGLEVHQFRAIIGAAPAYLMRRNEEFNPGDCASRDEVPTIR
jgi:hypothetical protein